LLFVAPIVAVWLGWTFFRLWYGARRIHSAVVRGGDDEVIYRFEGDGVTMRGPGSTTSLALRTLVRVKEGKTAFMLYVNPYVANIVPKRAFAPADVDRVRALLAMHVRVEQVGSLPRKAWVVLVVILAGLIALELRPRHHDGVSAEQPCAPAPRAGK
jgi:YcxB-like protein